MMKEFLKNRPPKRLASLDELKPPRRSKRLQLKTKKPEKVTEKPTNEKQKQKVESFGADVKEWLKGDKGVGPYGVPVKKWDSTEDETANKADKLFRSMKPKSKRRDRYDEEYDMGKVKKVKSKKGGRRGLGSQKNAFQKVQNRKFNARSRRKSSGSSMYKTEFTS